MNVRPCSELHVLTKSIQLVQTVQMSMMHQHRSLIEIFTWKFHVRAGRGAGAGGCLPKSLKLYSCLRYKRETYFSSAKPAVFRTTCRRNTRISRRTRTPWSVRWTAGEAEEKKVSAVDGVSYVWGENEVTVNPLSVAACLNVSIFHRRHFGLNFSSLIKIWERL